MEEIVVKKILENSPFQDSIEIGTPGKGGAVKVYGDFGNAPQFEERIKEAIRLRKIASQLIEEG